MTAGRALPTSIPFAKIAAYLLNPHHPRGGSKAAFFIGHGFSQARPKELADALFEHLVSDDTQHTGKPHPRGFGTAIVARGTINTPNATRPRIRSVWNQLAEDSEVIFITAYPD